MADAIAVEVEATVFAAIHFLVPAVQNGNVVQLERKCCSEQFASALQLASGSSYIELAEWLDYLASSDADCVDNTDVQN